MHIDYDLLIVASLTGTALAVTLSLYFIDKSLRQLDNSLLSLRLDVSQITHCAQDISGTLMGIQSELMRLSSAQAALAAYEERRMRAMQHGQTLVQPTAQGRYGAAQSMAQPRNGTDLRSGATASPPASQE